MGEQSAQGDQNVQLQNAQGPVWINFMGEQVAEAPSPTVLTTLWWGVPPIAAAFTGRQGELDGLEQALGADGRALITQAITGLGGVGKTQLAARYVHAHGGEYDVVAWIRAEEGGVADLSDFAAKLGEPVGTLPPVERRDLALERLRRGPERWLLVLDNVTSLEDLEACLPRGGKGRVLITSRDRALRQSAPLLVLDVFDSATAVDYLTERGGRLGDRAAAEQLATALGNLPLALSHAAAYCATGTSFEAYLELLDALPAEELFDRNPEASYEQTVASTWKISIQAAAAEASLSDELLAVAANLGPDEIPKSLFEVLLNDSQQVIERKRLTDAFNALARFSLFTVGDDTLSVHRLLQKVIRDDALGGDQRAIKRAVAALEAAFPAEPSDTSQWPLSERLLPHVLAVANAARVAATIDEALIRLLNRASFYLYWSGSPTRAVALAQGVVEEAMQALGSDHPVTLEARRNLGSAYRDAGRFDDAVGIYEPLLGSMEEVLGPEHVSTLNVRDGLAMLYRQTGRVDEAIAIYEPLLMTRERILGSEHRASLGTPNNLALAYDSAGRFADAIAIYQPLIDDQERLLGDDHPDALTTRNNLALAYRRAGLPKDAIAIYEPLVDAYDRVLGPEHLDTLNAHNNLANAYRHAGRVDRAITIYEPLMEDQERILGAEHPTTLQSRNNLAGAYLQADRIDEGISLYEAVLPALERVFGHEHPYSVDARRNLAAALQRGAGRIH